jgi:alkylhydroperoxidase family enzyme
MLAFAAKLTHEPWTISDGDVNTLRQHGFDDAQLWEIAYTTSIFNLFSRMADAFGIEPRPEWITALGIEG